MFPEYTHPNHVFIQNTLPIIGGPINVPAQEAAAGQTLIDMNKLRTAFSNPKVDIPLFYGDSALENLSAKFLLHRIRNARTTYECWDETTAGNFKLALRGKAIDWLNHTRDTLDVDISTSGPKSNLMLSTLACSIDWPFYSPT